MPRFKASLRYQNRYGREKGPLFVALTYRESNKAHPRIMNVQDDCLEINFVVEGEIKYSIDSKDYYAKTGDIVVFNAGTSHDEFFEEDTETIIYSLLVTKVNYQGLRENCLFNANTEAIKDSGKYFQSFLEQFKLLWAYQEKDTDMSVEISHHLVNIICLMTRELFYEEEDEPDYSKIMPLALRVKSYMDENFTKDLSLHVLSEKFNISPYYLSHIFKSQFNYSPLQYILRKRIGYAQTLLITTDLSIGEIAEKVGYKNQSHFNLLFTKNVGTAPRKYRMNYIS